MFTVLSLFISLVVIQKLTKDTENGRGPGNGQESESGLGRELKSFIYLSNKLIDC